MGPSRILDEPGLAGDDYYDLGDFHMPVTASNEAQTWFNRGLVWTFGFNHEEAVSCFQRAVAADPECAMAYWGIAYALGPNYNKPWGVFDPLELARNVLQARVAIVKALSKAHAASAVERALIDALQHRYPQEQLTPSQGYAANHAFAGAMEQVYGRHPDDPNVTAVYVDALMNLTPWQLWDIRSGKPAEKARTLDAKAALERALSEHPHHPGLLHLYIHLMEMSRNPEQALQAADRLRGLVPDAGHLNHMPTHIDVLCGDYRQAVASNAAAIKADTKFVSRDGAINFYSLYRCHDFHFRIYAAMFAGQSAVALETAAQLEQTLPEALLRIQSPPMADWLEGFLSMRVHILVRFGRWQDITQLELPADRELYCVTTAMIHYAKGVALANMSRIQDAGSARQLFREAAKNVPPSRTVFNNTCRDILKIAAAMLDGEIEYRRGNTELGFQHLRRAIKLDDSLPYDEPWGWMQPTRHAYGALLLEQGRVEEALDIYTADLGFDDTLPRAQQHRNNVWALHGLHECLTRLGRQNEARMIRPQLDLALAAVDVPIMSSCFCRSSHRE
ncbi:970aee8e-26b8-41a8-8104-c483523fc850 [Thermothielavioides terrestris]|uniref:970aee8e-26b8-41a8-8104-c483523fc850 n=1 Tax=Thermothielavioides terrestris TaxID=2587410 RepID=A0A3S4B2I2_9PEZI|nr:970aee8e-26b8-41a8-8104-c483523fc850 [Thermothielavioides terrestris]